MTINFVSQPGPPGTAGATWRAGSGAPSNSLGVDNDLYLDELTDNVWQRQSGTYVILCNIGGTAGSQWRVGSGAPSNSLGVNGDLYLDEVTANVWQRSAGEYAIVANVKGTAGTNGTNGAQGPRGLSTRLLSAGNFMQATNSQPVLSDGIVTGCNAIETRWVPVGGGDLVITLSNKNGTGPVTYTASAQWPVNLTPEPFTWNGVASVTLQPGQEVDSDPFIGQQNVWGVAPPATSLAIRLFLTCASGVKFEYNIQSGGGQMIGSSGNNPQTDQTGNYTFNYNATGSAGTPQVGISALKGAPLLASNAVVAVGDSIPRGEGDSVGGSSTFNDFGPIYYACGGFAANALQWANCAIVGETATQFATNPRPRRQMYLQYADKIIVMYGTNDIGYNTGISLATLQATLIKAWWACGGLGARVIACTLLPRSTSTDNYETVNNQTPVAGWGPGSVAALYNAWMIGGAPMIGGVAVAIGTVGAVTAGQTGHPLYAVCNWTAPVEAGAQGSGVWVINGSANYATPDGTHPADAAAQLMGAALRPLLLAA